MNIDLTKLITSHLEEIEIDGYIEIPDEMIKSTSIRELRDIRFIGSIMKLCDGDYNITGKLTGVMVLPDDITLEDVEVMINTEIDENFSDICKQEEKILEIIQNRLDITEFLWQNILVEIPLKVVSEKNAGITLEGDGWRLITEDELVMERSNNSPFSELSKMFDSRKE